MSLKKGGTDNVSAPAAAAAAAEKVVVAVKAAREIPKSAIVWALTHVVQPGDCITLLVLLSSHNSGRKWGFPRLTGDCASGGHRRSHTGTALEQKSDISDLCSQMMLQLNNVYDPNKINIKVKVVPGSPRGVVAAESKRAQASWVVLDKQLKTEEKRCMEELQCSIAVMKHSQAKVLRLNLIGRSLKAEVNLPSSLPKATDKPSARDVMDPHRTSIRGLAVTPTSSSETETPSITTDGGTSSVSSSDPGTSPSFVLGANLSPKKGKQVAAKGKNSSDATSSDINSGSVSPLTSVDFQPWVAEILSAGRTSSKRGEEVSHKLNENVRMSSTKALKEKLSENDIEAGEVGVKVLLSRNAPPGPPPLCSICQHKAPVFGKPPRRFSYAELGLATGGFSRANFLAEGGFGSVHRGVLPDGQAVAVKQHKLASTQGDLEFCSEVEVLSCAQHRNVVMLIGFCVENRRRLLVYEYICNGSLDLHLYGHNREPLEWSARQKVAVGAARGLRYLHEECRVGCIVHRDMRPNNILITHDFEPLVGDFGLARWQPDGDLGVETRVIGTFGYLAPEYAQSGQITEKADVYSFGVVLVELITGRKAVDISRPKGQQCLTEWARPLLQEYAIEELIDPQLGDYYMEQELYCMLHAASLCIQRDPNTRPRMSQVLRILEGDVVMESNCVSTPEFESGNMIGCRRGHAVHEGSEGFGGMQSFKSTRLRGREGRADISPR